MSETAVETFQPDTYAENGAPVDLWNGKKTRLRLAYPLVRDFQPVSEGDTIVVNASKGEDGEYYGPEAEHLRELIRLGHVEGTPEADERRRETAQVEGIRGVGDVLRDDNNRPILDAKGQPRRKFQELRPQTGAQMKQNRVLRDGMFGDKERMQNSEHTENQSAIKELTDAMVRIATGGTHAGAQAAGSAQAPDGTNLLKEKK